MLVSVESSTLCQPIPCSFHVDPLQSQGPRAHLREGGNCHTVGSLLECPSCLGGEGPGGCAVVRGREGQVILVQKVACAAAFALLQAVGMRDSVAGQAMQHTGQCSLQVPLPSPMPRSAPLGCQQPVTSQALPCSHLAPGEN